MHAAGIALHRRGHAGMPIARRQLDQILPGHGNSKPKKPKQSGNDDIPPLPAPLQEPGISTTTPANRGSTPTGLVGGGGGYDSSTSTTSQRTLTTTSSPTPTATGDYNRGSTTSSESNSNTEIVNLGSGSYGTEKGGLSESTSATSATTLGTPDSSPSTTNPSALSNGQTSTTAGGAIAAAVIFVLLFVIAVVVFILRKRAKARRLEQANRWGFTQNRISQNYGDDVTFNSPRSSRSSSRSSFHTSFDHSSRAFLGHSAVLPPPPPMAEFGRPSGASPSLVLDVNADEKRFSIGSANSDNSQFLVVHHRQSLKAEYYASVSECTEAFPFPKPPPVDTNSLHSKASGSVIFRRKEEPEVIYIASPPGIQPITPFLPTIPPIRPSLLSNPFADNNPFEDSTPLAAPVSGTISEVETVRRPFVPQLQDELRVDVGDSVRIVQTFDDGWILVEKVSPTCEQGLIPLDCLRTLMLNSSVEVKRVSSQGAQKA